MHIQHRTTRNPFRTALALTALFCLPLMGGVLGPDAHAAEDKWVAITTGIHAKGISDLEIHPKEPDVWFAHVHGMGAARSKDGGKTWERIMNGVKPPLNPRSPIRITLDPTKPRFLYLVVEGQVYKSEDAGDSWSSITTGAIASYSRDGRSTAYLTWEVEINQGKTRHLLIGTRGTSRHHGGLYESTDQGKTWKKIAASNLPRSELGEEGHDVFFVRLDPKTEKNVFCGGRNHTWRSQDRGRTWEMDDPGGPGRHDIRTITNPNDIKNLYLGDARGVWESRGVAKKWGKKPIAEGDILHLSGAAKQLYAVHWDTGIWKSEGSRHKKWKALGPDSDGYAGMDPHEVAHHPKDKKRFFVLSGATGLHETTDDGATIQEIEGNNIPTIVPGLADAVVHPAGDHVALALTEHGVVFVSKDKGQTWARAGRIGQEPHTLVPGAAAGLWYATGRRLMKSTDDGTTWTPFFAPGDAEDRVLGVAHADIEGKKTLLCLLERTGEIVKTDDDGKSWTKTKAPPISDTTWASSLAVNPSNPQHMIMATRTLRLVWSDQDTDGGVFETMDGGKSWVDITRNLKPTKKESATDRNKKANWNRGRLVMMDGASGVMLYGADGGGLWGRSMPNAEGKIEHNDWFPLTPKQMPQTNYGAVAHHEVTTTDGKPGTSRITLQLFNPEAETSGLVTIDHLGLRAMYDYACPARRKKLEEEKGEALVEPGGWQDAASPGHVVSSLHAVPGTDKGLIGADGATGKGVLFYAADVKPPAPEKPDGGEEKPKGPPKLTPPDGLWGFSASADQDINVWDLRSKKRSSPLRGHNAEVYTVRMAADETVIASGGADKKVRLWDGSQLDAMGAVDAPGSVTCLVFDDDSEKLYAGCDSWQIVMIDVASKSALGLLEGSAGSVLTLAVTEDTSKLYSGGKDGKVRIWDTSKREQLQEIDFGTAVYSISVSADGGRIYVGGQADTVKIYNPLGEEIGKRKLEQSVVMTMKLSPEGDLLYVGGEGGIYVLKADDLTDVRKHTGPEKAILCLDLSADGIWVFGGDEDNGLWLWQHNIEESVWNNPGAHAGAVFSVGLSPDETEVGNAELPPEDDKPKDGDGDGEGDKPKDGDAKPEDAPKQPDGG